MKGYKIQESKRKSKAISEKAAGIGLGLGSKKIRGETCPPSTAFNSQFMRGIEQGVQVPVT
jgi:hypothetical protein